MKGETLARGSRPRAVYSTGRERRSHNLLNKRVYVFLKKHNARCEFQFILRFISQVS